MQLPTRCACPPPYLARCSPSPLPGGARNPSSSLPHDMHSRLRFAAHTKRGARASADSKQQARSPFPRTPGGGNISKRNHLIRTHTFFSLHQSYLLFNTFYMYSRRTLRYLLSCVCRAVVSTRGQTPRKPCRIGSKSCSRWRGTKHSPPSYSSFERASKDSARRCRLTSG